MRALIVCFLSVGVLLLLVGYVPWWTPHEAIEIRTAQNVMTVLAGWALTVMGYLGLQLVAKSSSSERRAFPVIPRRPDTDA